MYSLVFLGIRIKKSSRMNYSVHITTLLEEFKTNNIKLEKWV